VKQRTKITTDDETSENEKKVHGAKLSVQKDGEKRIITKEEGVKRKIYWSVTKTRSPVVGFWPGPTDNKSP